MLEQEEQKLQDETESTLDTSNTECERSAWEKYRAPLFAMIAVAVLLVGVSAVGLLWRPWVPDEGRSQSTATPTSTEPRDASLPAWIDQQLIAYNGHARDGELLQAVNNIVVHYVGNPGTSAQNNRDYFNQPQTMVSSHFVVGLKGEVILCVPLREVSSASNHRNKDTISIEVCHPDETGQFNQATYRSVVRLCAWLCERYGLEATDVIRHHDVTGKYCPLYYVEHPEAWEQFIQDVADCKG